MPSATGWGDVLGWLCERGADLPPQLECPVLNAQRGRRDWERRR